MITNIKHHTPSNTDNFLLDTNIWLFLFCPIANHKQHIVSNYSSYYAKLIKNKSTIYTTSMILSEFINRYLRIDCGLNGFSAKDYKKSYRTSAQFKSTYATIEHTVKNSILKYVTCLDDEMTTISFNDVFTDSLDSDFNDSYMSNLVKGKNIAILTDDGDFSNLSNNHDIYTSNPYLLKSK